MAAVKIRPFKPGKFAKAIVTSDGDDSLLWRIKGGWNGEPHHKDVKAALCMDGRPLVAVRVANDGRFFFHEKDAGFVPPRDPHALAKQVEAQHPGLRWGGMSVEEVDAAAKVTKAQPSAGQLHVDGFGGGDTAPRKRKKGKREMKLLKATEAEFERELGDVADVDGAADQIRKADAHELAKDAAHAKLAKRAAAAGLPVREPIAKARLTTKQRKRLPDSDFVFPKTREYPIQDEAHARNALSRGAQNETGERLAKIRAAVKRRYPDIKVSKADLGLNIPIWKDDAKQIVYGVVLTPGVRDSQGDIVSAEEIEKAAHGFLTEYRKHDVQHDERAHEVQTVESYIAPQDMKVAGQKVLKGSWVLGAHVSDRDTWQRCSKADHPEPLTGFSIGGTGERLDEAA